MENIARPCIVWGATGQAKVVYDILKTEGVMIVHFFENNKNITSPIDGVPISYGLKGLIDFIDTLDGQHLRPGDIDCISAIGGANGEDRESMARLMEANGFKSRSVIHKSAIISPLSKIGSNVQVLAGSIVGAFASIGNNTIINTGANVDHDCIIGRNCHLGPRATLAGEVIVEDNSFIGTNATILPRKRICMGSLVGAGAVVTKDVSTGAIVVGNPARTLVN